MKNIKKISLFISALILTGAVLNSCNKYSRKKITNEWTVASYNIENTYTDESSSTSTIENGNTNSYINSTVIDGIMSSTSDGKIIENSRTYGEDGSLEMIFHTEITDNVPGDSVQITNTKVIQSGTWAFLGKNKTGAFKKNERIIQTILKFTINRTETTTPVSGGTPLISTYENSETYSAGIDETTLLITESTKNSLILVQESNNQYSYSNNGGTASTYGSAYNGTWTLSPISE